MVEQTERRVVITLPPASSGTQYLDLGLIYAAANHRFMKQGHNFVAKFELDGDPSALLGGDEQFVLEVLPTTWPMYGAYKQSRKIYELAVRPEEGLTARKSRWHDFRVYYDTAHALQVAGGVQYTPNGINTGFGGGSGEYVYSFVNDDAGTNTYSFHMIGNSDMAGTTRSFGAVFEYDRQNDTSVDESSGVQTNYSEILNDVDTGNEARLQETGDLPPYNKDNLQLPQKIFNLYAPGSGSGPGTSSLGYGVRSTGFIDVPMGLVKISNNIEGTRQIIITFKAGKNKGIHAEVI